MTASETAARKKELTENFTIEELADMYLASELRYEDAVAAAKKMENEMSLQIDALKTETEKLRADAEERKLCEFALRQRLSEQDKRYQDDCIQINQLNVALDVIMKKYVRMEGLLSK